MSIQNFPMRNFSRGHFQRIYEGIRFNLKMIREDVEIKRFNPNKTMLALPKSASALATGSNNNIIIHVSVEHF